MHRWGIALGLTVVGAWLWSRAQRTAAVATLSGDTVVDQAGHVVPLFPPTVDLSLPLNDPLRIQSDGNSVVQQPGSPLGLVINAGAL